MDGDGFPDFIYDSEDVAGISYIRVLLNNSGEGFATDDDTAIWGKRLVGYNTNGGGFKLADVDGDGLSDFIYDNDNGGSNIRVLINTGSGFEADTEWGHRKASYNTNAGGFMVADLNGDGLADFIYDSSDNGSKIHVLLNDRYLQRFTDDSATCSTGTCWGKRTASYNTNAGGYRLADANGDGLPDFIYDSSDNGGFVRVLLNTGEGFTDDDSNAAWGKRTNSYNSIEQHGRPYGRVNVDHIRGLLREKPALCCADSLCNYSE